MIVEIAAGLFIAIVFLNVLSNGQQGPVIPYEILYLIALPFLIIGWLTICAVLFGHL